MLTESRKARHNSGVSENGVESPSIFPAHIDALLEGIEEQGRADGKAGIPADRGRMGIAATVRLGILKKVIECRALGRCLIESIECHEQRLSMIQKTLKSLREEVEKGRGGSLLWGLLYTLSGAIFVAGDVALSYEIIIRAWGLGNQNPLHTWSLVIALGLTPILAEFIYARLIWVRIDTHSGVLPKSARWFLIAVAPLVILSFGYFGFLRGVVMTYIQKFGDGRTEMYGLLLGDFPYLNIVAFVLLAVLFILGAAVLLTSGISELRRYHWFRRDGKNLQGLVEEERTLQDEIHRMGKELSRVTDELELVESEQGFEQMLETQVTFYEAKYLGAYRRSLKEALMDPENRMSLGERFHLFGQAVIDQTAVNDAVELFVGKEQGNGR